MNLKEDIFLKVGPPSSHVIMKFPKTDKTKGPVELHWMDGGIQPERPDELGPNETFGDCGKWCVVSWYKGQDDVRNLWSGPKVASCKKELKK